MSMEVGQRPIEGSPLPLALLVRTETHWRLSTAPGIWLHVAGCVLLPTGHFAWLVCCEHLRLMWAVSGLLSPAVWHLDPYLVQAGACQANVLCETIKHRLGPGRLICCDYLVKAGAC